MAGAHQEQSLGLGMLCYEDGTWGLTTFGVAKAEPPHDFAGMCDLADEIVPAAHRRGDPRRPNRSAMSLSTSTRPAGGAGTTSSNASRVGILPFGDAVASFNPTYGQGMTMTSLQAGHLRRALESPEAERRRDVQRRGREVDVPGVDDERDRGLRLARRLGHDAAVVPARSAGSSISSSGRPRRIPFSPNGFYAGSASSTACTWSRRCHWSAARSGTTCGCSSLSKRAARSSASDRDLVRGG